MKIYRRLLRHKIKSLVILLNFLIIPAILSSPLLTFLNSQKNKENEVITSPKLNSPNNAHYFSFYKDITIDHNKVAGTATYPDFPVLISILDTDLRFNVQSDGDDIAFSYENTWLAHEIELFDQTFNSTHAKLISWVKVPSLSGIIDTSIRMYYSNSTMGSQQNPSAVWENNYRGVWHLNEQTGGTYAIIDSSTYSNDGSDINSPLLGQGGQIYNSIGFTDASGQRIEVPDDTSLDISSQLTVEAWINPTVDTKWMTIVSKMAGTWGNGLLSNFDIYIAINDFGYYDIGLSNPSDVYDEWSSSVSVSTGTWQHFVFAYQSSTSMGRIFVNGAFMAEHNFGIGSLGTNGNPFYIGFNRGWTGEVFDGLIDEVRISSFPRSAGWIYTEYQNQNDPNSFYTIGSEKVVASTPPNAHYFTYYKIITIDHNKVAGTGSHSNFPLLISLIDNNLKYHTQSNGDDIAFSIEGDWLDHEIEFFNQSYSDTHAQLIVWVQVPFLSASEDTIITMYYGNSTMNSRENPSGVWTSNYVNVLHLNEDPSGAVFDSTFYSNDGVSLGSMNSLDLISCKIGKGFELDGIDDMISVSDSASLDSTNDEGTLSIWVKWVNPAAGRYQRVMTTSNRFATNPSPPPTILQIDGFELAVQADGDNFFYPWGGSSSDYNLATNPFSNSYWHYLVVTLKYSTKSVKIYLNGSSLSLSIENVPTYWTQLASLNDWLWGGNNIASGSQFQGSFDEIRVSNIEHSSYWILTEFNNQNDPNSFYTIDTEQRVLTNPVNANFFDYYKIITIDHTKVNGIGSHVNFPLLISLVDEDLHYDVQNDGDDIAFSIDGKWLDHQIERFNQDYSGTEAELIVWVRIPFLSTAFDTNITIYYGNSTMNPRENPSGVWISGYVGVWHLNEDPSDTPPQIKDSTDPPTDGSSYGTMTTSDQVTGVIDGSLDFDGNDDYVDFGNPGEVQITGELTVQAWFKADIFIDNDYLVAKHDGTNFRGWDISFDDDPGINPDGWMMFRYSPDGINMITTGYERVKIDKWYHVVGIFKPNDYSKFFINGTEVAITTTGVPSSINDPPYPLRIARRSDSSTSCFDGIIDEVRISNIARSNDWIATEYNNQFDPHSFYSVGLEQRLKPGIYVDAQINALDLYGNLLPNVTISMYSFTQLIDQGISDIDGGVSFTNIIEGEYNFTVTISSNIDNIVEVVNSTSQAIMLDQPFQTINLICDVSTHFFEVIDVDTNPVESGWIIVGNATHQLQKCVLDPSGHTKFWWVDAPPSTYNYTFYYSNPIYNPSIITLASGDITTVNATIQIQVELTTIEFTVQTFNAPITPVSGAKLKLNLNNPLGPSIVNLTTDINGQATLRWLTSLEIGGDYSLRIEFFGADKLFNQTVGGPANTNETSFTVTTMDYLEFRILIDLSKFQTELISLNPTDYIEVEWGTLLTLRGLFNVSKVEEGYESLLGPVYADLMRYQLLLGGITVRAGSFLREEDNEGRHFVEIDTKQLDSKESYILIISAYKSGYTIPSDKILQLNILENDVELNQSNNDDSDIETYWLETANMTLNSYGTNFETLTVENMLFQSVNHEFDFLISDIETHWNLSMIVLNLYNISWNVGVSEINITIEDPFGTFYMFNSTTHLGWDYAQGIWTGITLNLNRASRTNDNNFEFLINGTFDNTVDIIAEAYFIRDAINVQYSQFNISSEISLLTEVEGWVISNVSFEIFDCYNSSDWSLVDLSTLTDLNITTNEGFTYSLYDGAPGTGTLIIDDRTIYPIGNQFLFTVESDPNIIFNAIVKVEYIQGFYKNQFLETLNRTISDKGISNGGLFQVNAGESSWSEQEAVLWVKNIKSGLTYFFPSDLAMNITIGGQKYSISDYALGTGTFYLSGFSKEQILHTIIETSSPVNFTLLFSIQYSRTVSHEIIGSLSYAFVEAPSISGSVQYNTDLAYYLKIIDTNLLDADEYTIRFTIDKDHYKATTKDLGLIILNRPTLLNQSSEFFRKIESVYVKDAVNFTLVYTDALRGNKITNLKTQYYVWERYDNEGNVIESGYGNIFSAIDNTYILDFDTESRTVGEYLLIVTLEKENYDYKNAMMLLTIKKREIGEPILSDNFQNRRTSVVKGKSVPIQIILTDPTKYNSWLLNATITLKIRGILYNFTYTGNGTYAFNFPTYNINAFFTSTTLTGTINITKEDYISQEFDIVIVVEMEQIFPGIPTFYFLLILSVVVALVGSIVGYRVYHYAKIPAFVRKVREMKKAIKKDKNIAESLIYGAKEKFIGEILKRDWAKIDVSIEEVLGITIEKEEKKSISKRRATKITEVHDKKPLGLLLMKWDERIGTEILAKYPKDISVSEKTLMQVYSTHEYSGEKGSVTLTAEVTNILSYYTGPEEGYYLLLILSTDDDPDLYEGGMADILRDIISNLEDDSYIHMIPTLFQRISLYPSLSSEEILALTYQNKIIRTIINLLREDGVITKSELNIWLKDKFVEGFFDLDAILTELIKLEIIKVSSVKNIPSELILLTTDIFMVRAPPLKLLDNPSSHGLPSQFAKEYTNDVKKFFQNYRPTEEDNIKTVEILVNPQVYETLKLLRTAIVTRQDLEKLRKKGVDDVYNVLKLLWDNQMIKVFHDEKNIEYYALLSDFYIEYIFPKYLLKAVKTEFEQKSKNKRILIEYLTILEESYFKLKDLEKSK
ncbi:MAG: DUF2341 domain-containing protein [Promethearchaeota archaeon]